MFFFFNDTATTEIYTLSLHDALPIFDFRVLGKVHRGLIFARVWRHQRCPPEATPRPLLALALPDGHVGSGGKRQPGLGRKLDVFFARSRSACRAGPGTRRRPNRSALASTRQRSDGCSSGCTAANKPCIPLALALLGFAGGAGREGIRFTLDGHADQMQVQFRRRRQPSRSLYAADG